MVSDRWSGALALVAATAAGLAVGWISMGHPFGFFRRFEHLLPDDPGLAVRVVAGLAFDPAGGLAFAAPLALAAVALAGLLWRRGGPGERGVIVGAALTGLALLHSKEWYGGGSPPVRYLVPLLPAAVLAWGVALPAPLRPRRLAEILVAPSVIAWWALVTRPHFSVNPGDGGWWLSEALARRLQADVQHLVPSFLAPSAASLWVPPLALAVAAVAVVAGSRHSSLLRVLVRSGSALVLAAATAVTAAVVLHSDRIVEVEAAQVRRQGGAPQPPAGTFSRFEYRRGWLVRNGDGRVAAQGMANYIKRSNSQNIHEPPQAKGLRIDAIVPVACSGAAAITHQVRDYYVEFLHVPGFECLVKAHTGLTEAVDKEQHRSRSIQFTVPNKKPTVFYLKDPFLHQRFFSFFFHGLKTEMNTVVMSTRH